MGLDYYPRLIFYLLHVNTKFKILDLWNSGSSNINNLLNVQQYHHEKATQSLVILKHWESTSLENSSNSIVSFGLNDSACQSVLTHILQCSNPHTLPNSFLKLIFVEGNEKSYSISNWHSLNKMIIPSLLEFGVMWDIDYILQMYSQEENFSSSKIKETRKITIKVFYTHKETHAQIHTGM